MKIAIVGLGLIGASYALGLTKKGHEVYGIDKDLEVIKYAIEHQYIIAECSNIKEIDLIILAIYPQSILSFLQQHHNEFVEGQVITDVCGVKSSFINKATILAGKAVYLSHHPMAGKEKIGIRFADEQIFKGANFLITPLDRTPIFAIKLLDNIAKDLNFGKVTVIPYQKHDEMIGFTSQLTHAIAVALVNSDRSEDTKNFIGDSYRDLTRIAMINENLWSELFLENKEQLMKHIESFEEEMDKIKLALKEQDKQRLNELFKKSTIIRKKMEK